MSKRNQENGSDNTESDKRKDCEKKLMAFVILTERDYSVSAFLFLLALSVD